MLAVTTLKRSSAYPDLPTLTESGISGLDTSLWFRPDRSGSDAETGHRQDHDDVVAPRSSCPTCANASLPGAATSSGNTPEEFAAFIAAESAKYAEAIKRASVKLD